MAYKTFVNGFPLNASELNNNFMNQVISTFADASARSTAIAAPVEGQITYLIGTNDYWKWDGSAWVELEALSPDFTATSSPNYIINGAFDIWQRGTSFSVTGAMYTADRWEANPSGGAGTVTQEEFTPAEIEAIGFGDAKYFLRYDLTTADDAARLEYPIEDVRTLAGQTATVSFWAKTNATNLDVRLDQLFGSGGSSNVNNEQNITLTTSWARYSVTFDLASISGKTIGTDSYLRFQLYNPNFETFTLDVWGVQVEAGSTATSFRRNANSIQGELAACQRYYQKVGIGSAYPLGLGFATSTSNARVTIPLACNMRATPSVEDDSATIRHEGTNYSISSFSSVVLGNGAMVTLNAATTVSSMTPNQLAVISANDNFALSSEL